MPLSIDPACTAGRDLFYPVFYPTVDKYRAYPHAMLHNIYYRTLLEQIPGILIGALS